MAPQAAGQVATNKAAAFLSGWGEDEDTPGTDNIDVEGQPMQIFTNASEPENPETTPVKPTVNRRLRWDPETQQLLPVE